MAQSQLAGPTVKIGLAEYRVAKAPMIMMTMALGSCLGIALYDDEAKIGGLAHVMHPKRGLVKNNINKAKFVDSAIALMLERMVQRGAKRNRIIAKLFGGARMFTNYKGIPGVLQIGEKNILSARERLNEFEIPVVAECVGGDRGRTVCFDVSDGSVLVRDAGGAEIVL